MIIEESGSTLLAFPKERLDSSTAGSFEEAIIDRLDGMTELVVDLSDVDYVSSKGVRVIVSLHRKMQEADGLVLRNANNAVTEILRMSGLQDILNIE